MKRQDKKRITKHILHSLVLLFAMPAAASAQLVLSTPQTGEFSDPLSITLKPGFQSTNFHAFISTLPQPVVLGSLPSSDQNYILKRIYLKDSVSVSPKTDEVMEDVAYFDGLGRPVQMVGTKAGPAYQDIVTHQDYDAFGRDYRSYLPYATSAMNNGSYKTNAITAQASFYNSGTTNDVVTIPASNGVTPSFSVPVYEGSPLNRVLEQGAPGQVWQPASSRTATSGRTVVTEYATNNTVAFATVATTRRVALYRVSLATDGTPTLTLANGAVYGAGELYVTVTKDENWEGGNGTFASRLGTTEEYRDKEGRVVLKRIFNVNNGANEVLSTYYVYDDFGNLTYVLTPGAMPDRATLPTGTALTDWLARYVYQYRYDTRNRVVEKQLPSKGREYIVYNQLDQVVASQDANQQVRKEWTVSKYDGLGRTVLTGLWTNGGTAITRDSIQAWVNAQKAPNLWEERNAVGTAYTSRAWPTSGLTILGEHFYDDYNIAGLLALPTAYRPMVYSGMTQGLPTASRVNVLGTSSYLWTVSYYDERGDNVRTISQHYKGGIYNINNYDDTKNEFTFTHKLKKSTREHHTGSATAALTLITEYTYDHRDRLVDTWKMVKSGSVQGARTLMARNEYNSIGQLKAKKLHSTDEGSTFAQSIAYSYNERGWLRTADAPLFNQELVYNTGTNKYYNGNIAYQNFTRKYTSSSTATGSYSYTYDKLNRLLSGTMAGNIAKEELGYDVLGNITSLKRTGTTSAYEDNMAYAYNAKGQLQTVTDAATGTNTAYQPNGTTTYTYDANGNLLTRVKSGGTANITATTYNVLNLPQSITVGGVATSYVYDAMGRKLRSVNAINGEVRDYIDGIEYAAGTLDFVQMEEGRLVNEGSNNYGYEYFLRDHLGNTRSGFAGTAPATPTFGSDYYPYGMQVQQNLVADNPKNSYLYNGKELQDGLKTYDYGARFYDPVIGRWGSLDPSGEKYESVSPYNYAFNNPLRFIDIEGMDPGDIVVLFSGANMAYPIQSVTSSTKSLYNNLVAHNNGEKIVLFPTLYKYNLISTVTGLSSERMERAMINRALAHIMVNLEKNPQGRVVLYGYSYGGVIVGKLVERLKEKGIDVNLLVTVDAADGPWSDEVNRNVPDNVDLNLNFFETNGKERTLSDPTGSYGNRNQGKNVVNIDQSSVKYKGEKVNHINIDDATLSISEDVIKELLKNMGKDRKTLTRDEILALFR